MHRIIASIVGFGVAIMWQSASLAMVSKVPSEVATPTLNCTASSCALPEGDFSATPSLCNGVYGACPKPQSPLADFSTPCESYFKYNKYSTFVDGTADPSDGVPIWSKKTGTGAIARTAQTIGPGQASNIALTGRLIGDDETCEGGSTENCRVAAFPKLMQKGDDACRWYNEAANHVSSALSAAARYPYTVDAVGVPNTPELYGALPSLLCQSLPKVVMPPPREYANTYDGGANDPGGYIGPETVRASLDVNRGRNAPVPDPLATRSRAGQLTFKGVDWLSGGGQGANPHYDRGANSPIRSADSMLFLRTPAYATYDPSEYRPGQEQKLASILAKKTPEEVARIRDQGGIQIMGKAHASIGNAFAVGSSVMCAVRPEDCHLTGHFDNISGGHLESFHAMLPRDNQISTPNISFLPVQDLIKKMPGLPDALGQIGGKLFQQAVNSVIEPAATKALTSSGVARCLVSMKNPLTYPITQASYQRKAAELQQNCQPELLSCLQAHGGYSHTSLNSCYKTLNNIEDVVTSNLPNGATYVMSEVANFMCNGNVNCNISGLNPGNLAQLAGADIAQLNKVLMQKVPNLGTSVGGLVNHAGQFFGKANTEALGPFLATFKQHPYVQKLYGVHDFDVRTAMALTTADDHYSGIAIDQCSNVSSSEAALCFFRPWFKGRGGITSGGSTNSLGPAGGSEAPSNSQDCFGANCSSDAIGVENNTGPGAEASLHDVYNVTKNLANLLKLSVSDDRDSPLYFGPDPSHIAIGMPKTDETTGPLIIREDGTVYYAKLPDVKVNFIAKTYYTKEDVEKGYLPKQFADYLPENHDEPWTRLALTLTEHGGIGYLDPKVIDQTVARVNETFRQSGSNAVITANVLRQGAMDYLRELEQGIELPEEKMFAEKQPSKLDGLFDSLGISSAKAISLPGGATRAAPGAAAGIPSNRDIVRCAGDLASNRIRVDVLKPRYARFNGHVLLRNVMNRWWMCDAEDPRRCQKGGFCCAPKPCPGKMSAWSKACWAPTHNKYGGAFCMFPPAVVGPSDRYPLAAVSHDYGPPIHDIGHFRNINNACGKVPSPLYKPVKGGCHFFDSKCRQTRAYNCRVFAGGFSACSYTWGYHVDAKLLLHEWARTMGGDIAIDVGERHMKDECRHLSAPIALINKFRMGNLVTAARNNLRIPAGVSFIEYMGTKMPYIKPDDLGRAAGDAGVFAHNMKSAKGAYIYAMSAVSDNPITKQLLNLASFENTERYSPIPGQQKPTSFASRLLATYAPSAHAMSAGGNTSSNGPCMGGEMTGASATKCSEFNRDPMLMSLEQGLLQMKMVRNFGLACMPSSRVLYADSAMAMHAEMCGATVTMDVNGSGQLRSVNYPLTARNNYQNASAPWPAGGGADAMQEALGANAALDLGANAGCSVIIMDKGGGGGLCNGPDSKCAPPTFGVVTDVNKKQGWIRAVYKHTCLLKDAAGQCINSTRQERTLYLPGKFPASLKATYQRDYGRDPDCYQFTNTKDCELHPEAVQTMRVYTPQSQVQQVNATP